MKKIAIIIRDLDEVKFGLADSIEDVDGYGYQIYLRLYEIDSEEFERITREAPNHENEVSFMENEFATHGELIYDSIQDNINEDPLDPETIKMKIKRHEFKETRGKSLIDVTIDPLHKYGLTEDDMIDMLMHVDSTLEKLYAQGIKVTKDDAIDMYEDLRLVKYIQLMLKAGKSFDEIERTIIIEEV